VKSGQSATETAVRLLKTLGQNVKDAREAMGLTQRELAAKAGTGQRRINVIELGGGNPTLLTIVRIGKCLDRTTVELLTPPPSKTPKP
jgi:transcriptional regulator with XRE-family HTH domain